jgi:predicted permease
MDWLADVRFAFRTLLKNPGFTAVAVAMLALGIGVNATVFTVTNAVLFKGFPLVAKNDRMAYISNNGCCLSYPDFEDYRAQAKSFDGLAITHGVARIFSDGKGFPERLSVTEVSADAFPLVGQHPILGRDFAAADEVPGAPGVAILNYAFWVDRYAKDPAVIGRTVRMNGAPTTFIGVMREGFSFPQKTDLWVPLVRTANVLHRANRDTWMAFGPLKPGATLEGARAEILTIAKRLAIAYPATDQDVRVTVQDFHEFMIGDNAALIYGSMWGAVGFVLLIACANLANLLLARAIGRSREISVRIALGAGRWRIIRQLLVESVLVSSLGGLAGWWLAKWGVRAYALAMAHKEAWLIVDYTMDHRVLGYLIAISIGTGLLFGLAPALRLSRLDVNSTLKDGGRGASAGGRAKHLSSLLVSGEMALAIVLLAGAGVMIRSFLKIYRADMGVNSTNILAGQVDLPNRYSSPEQQLSFFEHFKASIAATPGVSSVTIASAPPGWRLARMPYEIPGASQGESAQSRPMLSVLSIAPNYFHTLGARLLSGRDFTEHDGPSAPPVAIINERLARDLWPREDPVGKRVRTFVGTTPGPWLTVIGVSSNIIQSDQTRQNFDPVLYSAYRQQPAAIGWIIARTAVTPAIVAPAFRRELQAIDPGLPIYGPYPLTSDRIVYMDTAFYGTLFLIFAAIALLLASVGLYTVVAHSVSRRTQEIGVRMAIGATAADIRRLVFKQGMLPLGLGLAIGLVASLAVNRILKAELVQVSPADPVALLIASAVLILAAMLGCLIPARRAMRVDPVVALRHE